MSSFKIIPVIDVLNSEAVHAIKGERERYKPLKAVWINNCDPIKIVKKLKDDYEIKDIYIADLDAIIKKEPNFKLLEKILTIPNVKIIIDPGILSIKNVKIYSKYSIDTLILGLETIKNLKVISKCLKIYGKSKTIVSIDMYNELIQTNINELQNQKPIEIIKKIEDLGVEKIILLDLYKVGQKLGGIPQLYQQIRDEFKGNIIVGGGIKDMDDIKLYNQHNFSGVLIGTALHDGTINIDKIRKFNQS